MSTHAPDLVHQFAMDWEKLYKSAVFAGIVGDSNHPDGYHISIEDQSPSNYSVTRPDDKAPPGNWPRNMASAVDMSVNESDMFKIDGYVHKVWSDKSDPRRNYINAINSWDGHDSPGRYDMYANTLDWADDSHKWHVHWEFRRKYVNDAKAMRAGLSILKGETKDQWIANEGGGSSGDGGSSGGGATLHRKWPSYMPQNEYFGLVSGPHQSHGGYYSHERPDIKAIQQRLIKLGYVPGITDPNNDWADGIFEQPTKDAVAKWQKAKYASTTQYYGQVWSDDWKHLFTY